MKRRRLTVSSTPPESRARLSRPTLSPIPFLRLRGRWLESAGFAIGKPVRVTVARGLLAIEVIDTENDPD